MASRSNDEFRRQAIQDWVAENEDPQNIRLAVTSPTRHRVNHDARQSTKASTQTEEDHQVLHRMARVYGGRVTGGGSSGIQPWTFSVDVPRQHVQKFLSDLRGNHPDWGATTRRRVSNVDIDDPKVWPWNMYHTHELLKPQTSFDEYAEKDEPRYYYDPETNALSAENVQPDDSGGSNDNRRRPRR
jgi:hypothetical protein